MSLSSLLFQEAYSEHEYLHVYAVFTNSCKWKIQTDKIERKDNIIFSGEN